MKLSTVFLSGLLVVTPFVSSKANHGVYYNELKAFKKAEATQMMFDEDSHNGLAKIQRDVITYKHLTSFQRMVRFLFLIQDVVVVTSDTMPTLYAYVENVCKKAYIAMPTVFITREKTLFNAFAQKLLASTGAICIGQKLMRDISDDALEGVVAHEIGHIKHNHVNKMICINLATFLVVRQGCKHLCPSMYYTTLHSETFFNDYMKYRAKSETIGLIATIISCLIINKRFEKEADSFAYAANGKGEGLVEFFETLLKKGQLREDDFVAIADLLKQNNLELAFFDYYELLARLYIAKVGHFFGKAYKNLYYKTPWGAHPHPQARIAAAKAYLAQQENAQQA